jgi:DNA-binding response OmpR family regulator
MTTQLLVQPKRRAKVTPEPQTILIIDDDQCMVDVLTQRLTSQGYQTIGAESGEEGLRIARTDRPDLVILDLRLPDTDGLTVCQELADSSDTCSIPVFILSGMERPDIIRRSRAAGCQYFVRKPYDPNALLILIRHALDEAKQWQALS